MDELNLSGVDQRSRKFFSVYQGLGFRCCSSNLTLAEHVREVSDLSELLSLNNSCQGSSQESVRINHVRKETDAISWDDPQYGL